MPHNMKMKKQVLKFSLLLCFNIITIPLFGQLVIKNSTYTSWEGKSYQTYLIESKHTVIHIDKNELIKGQIEDLSTIQKIVNRVDTLYGFYKSKLGYEPKGGNPLYLNKADVFFGPPSCGSGCGQIGSKGIELSGFQNIFYNLKNGLNVNRDVIIGYEFGRNFFDFSSKILFPFKPNTDEKNGGFAEGFASIMYVYAFDEVMKLESERQLNETLLNLKWSYQNFLGYINDTTANPNNSLFKWNKEGVLDANRGTSGHLNPAYSGFSILSGIFQVLEKDKMFPNFFKIIRERPDANSIQDALSNIASAASKSSNANLLPFFKNVLKFDISSSAESEISLLPKMESRLIRDLPVLWFLSPFEKINLNIRGTNYLEDGAVYKILINGVEFSSSRNGNNSIPYSVLGSANEVKVQCKLIINQIEKDSYEVVLKKRHNINIFDYKSDLYAYYLSNKSVKSYFEDNTLVLEHLNKTIQDEGLIFYNLIFSRNRKLEIEGEIKQIAIPLNDSMTLVGGLRTSGYSYNSIYGPFRNNGSARVGYDIGKDDQSNYHKVKFSDQTNLFMPTDGAFYMNKIAFFNNGYGLKSYYRNFILRDITDTDGDGIVDFEDPCPTGANINVTIIASGPTTFCQGGKVTLTANGGMSYLWSTGATTQSIDVNASGNYTVEVTNASGCKVTSVATTVTVNALPTATIIASGATSFCQGGKVTLTASSGSSYLWSTGATTQSIDVTASGNYAVAVTNASGCKSTSQETIVTVNTLPTATIIASGPTTISQSGNVVLSANTGTGYTYQWFKDGGLLENFKTSSYIASTGGSYTVKITTSSGCQVTSEPAIVKTVYILPSNNFQINVQSESCRTNDNGKISIKALQNLNYTAILTKSGGAVETINFTSSVEFGGLAASNYTLCITVAGQPDYKQCYEISITEPKDLSVYSQLNPINNILKLALSGGSTYRISLNGKIFSTISNTYNLGLKNGLNKVIVMTDKDCQGVYQEELYINEKDLVYPNPFTDILNIKIKQEDVFNIQVNIYDSFGFKVYQTIHAIQNGIIQMDLSKLYNGYYSVVIGEDVYKVLKK